MKVITVDDEEIDLGVVETTPTISIVDYSRRVTDEFGITTIVKRAYSRRLSVRMALPFDQVDSVQRSLAGLRATSALWVADEDIDWLQVDGFYKDFELDLATPPTSFCTLSVEGLPELDPGADPGGDAAVSGEVSTLKMIEPVAITDAEFVSSNVTENDYAVWAIGTTYSLGQRVIKTATHRIYESLVAGNVGNDPAGSSGLWLDVGPTNRWAMLDQALGTVTSRSGGLTITLSAGAVDSVALVDVVGTSVRVQAPGGYDRTIATGPQTIAFLDLLGTAGNVIITVNGSGTVSVGTLLLGHIRTLGVTEAAPTAGINDFSRKEADDFGDMTIVQRAWSKRMSPRALIRTSAVDLVADRLARVRAKPVLWIADEGTDSLTMFGFYKDFSIEVTETTSTLSLTIEGFSEAATRAPAPDADDWDAAFTLLTSEGGFLPAIIVTGNVASDQASAVRFEYWLSDGTTPPVVVDDWTFSAMGPRDTARHAITSIAPNSDYYVAISYVVGEQTTDRLLLGPITTGDYATTADLEALGVNNATVMLYKRAASTPSVPSTTATYTFATGALSGHNNGWTQVPPANDGNPLYVTAAVAVGNATDTIATGEWAAPVVFATNGAAGAAGLNNALVHIYRRSASAPTLPSTTATYTFATGALTGQNNSWTTTVPSGSDPLYVSVATASSTSATDTIASGEWASPTIMAQDGAPGSAGAAGLNAATVFLYKRATSTPSVPSTTSTYTFATGVLTGHNNSWTQGIPAGTDPIYVITATAAATTSTDTIATGEWASPVVLAQNGAAGSAGAAGTNSATVFLYKRSSTAPSVPSTTSTYTFATGVLTGHDNGWTQAVPNGLDPLYVTTAAALANTATDTIATGEWAAPTILARNGEGAGNLIRNAELRTATDWVYAAGAPQIIIPASITASSNYAGYTGLSGSGMRDSDYSSNSSIHGTNNVPNPSWMTMDLGSVQAISDIFTVCVTSGHPDGWGPSWSDGTAVKTSNDGVLGTATTRIASLTGHANNTVKQSALNVSARYVHLVRASYMSFGGFYVKDTGGAAPTRQAGTTGNPTPGFIRFTGSGTATANDGFKLPIGYLLKAFLSLWAAKASGASGNLYAKVYWWDANGTALSGADEFTSNEITPATHSTLTPFAFVLAKPTNAALFTLVLERVGGSGNMDVFAPRLDGTEVAADVTSLNAITITSTADIVVNANYLGVVTSTLPMSVPNVAVKNGVAITTQGTWAVTVKSGTVDADMDSATGVLTIDDVAGVLTSSILEISFTPTGGGVQKIERKVVKTLADAPAPPPGGTGTTDSTAFSGYTDSTTPKAMARDLTVVAGAGGIVDLSLSYEFDTASSSGSFNEEARWYNTTSGATAIGTQTTSYGPFVAADGIPGQGDCVFQVTGLTPGATYKFRPYMWNSSGTVQRNIFNATASGVGS